MLCTVVCPEGQMQAEGIGQDKAVLVPHARLSVALGGEGCPPVATDTFPGLSLQDQELESLAAIEAELERVAHKLHELRRG